MAENKIKGADDADPGARPGGNKMRMDEKGDLAGDAKRIQSELDRYRGEMAEDAPAPESAKDKQ